MVKIPLANKLLPGQRLCMMQMQLIDCHRAVGLKLKTVPMCQLQLSHIGGVKHHLHPANQPRQTQGDAQGRLPLPELAIQCNVWMTLFGVMAFREATTSWLRQSHERSCFVLW